MEQITVRPPRTRGAAKKRIITIGGGTGQFHVLRALMHLIENNDLAITAIPTTIDSGGSSGILRLHYDIVAPGDISQCLYGLHPEPEKAAWLFDHRFSGNNGLSGHSVRNLIVAAALQQFGPEQQALDAIRDTFGLRGDIAPATFSSCQLHATLNDGTAYASESEIYEADLIGGGGVERLWLEPECEPNPAAIKAIREADIIIICPGTLVCSIIPNFLVEPVKEALIASSAQKIYVSNLMNRRGHVEKHWTILDHVHYLESFLTENFFDAVIANTQKPTEEQQELYKDEKFVVPLLSDTEDTKRIIIGLPLLSPVIKSGDTSDALASLRASVRHDPSQLARALGVLISA